MKRLGVAMLFASAAAAFAVSLRTEAAWLGVALALGSLLITRRFERDLTALRRLLYIALFGMVIFGWLLRAFPILNAPAMDAWTLALGYGIACLGGVFLFSAQALERTAVPAAAGVLTVASFDLDAAIHPYLVTAGLGASIYLAADVLPTRWRWRGRQRITARLALFGAFGLGALGVGAGIVTILPAAQQQLEDAMVAIYAPGSDGIQAQFRSHLGELQRLKLSKKVVMRVWSQRPQRLRSRALVRFDGTGWSRDPSALRSRVPGSVRLDDEEARAFISGLPGVDFMLDTGDHEAERWIRTQIVRVDGEGLVTPGGSFLVRAPLDYVQVDDANVVFPPPRTRLRRYGVLHAVNHQRAQRGPIADAVREAATELPENLDPRVRALASEIAAGASSPEAAAERIVAHLRNAYRYSLDVGPIDTRDPVADFLFNKKEGWCEFFATSAALLMRAEGIPTRYVRGYNVIGSQQVADHYVVRDWDRHAWVEAHIEGKGWLEYDPTPPSEYESLHASLGDGGFANAVEWVRSRLASLYVWVRELEPMDVVRPGLWLVALFVLGRLAVDVLQSFRSRSRRERSSAGGKGPTALDELVQAVDRALEQLGCPRPASRPPLEHWIQLPEDRLTEALRAEGRRLLTCYYRARFGNAAMSPDDVESLRALPGSLRVGTHS